MPRNIRWNLQEGIIGNTMRSDDSTLNNITLNYYNENALSFIKETQNASMFETLEEFIQYNPSGGRVLDIGCGSGRDSKYLLEHGFSVDAMDGSKSYAKLQYNLQVFK